METIPDPILYAVNKTIVNWVDEDKRPLFRLDNKSIEGENFLFTVSRLEYTTDAKEKAPWMPGAYKETGTLVIALPVTVTPEEAEAETRKALSA